ncbi:MAG: hypothetical protein COA47_03250 [Robiginitomaculum sp.]|nr:MAG: hypothetical protein COA47_03250 [Robiginitomaculum sp.]
MRDEFEIDPEMKPSLARMKERMESRPPMTSVEPAEMRQRAREEFAAMNQNPPELALVRDTFVEGAFGPCKIRIYDAVGERKQAPGLIYFHGGGWIVGDLDTEDVKLRHLALASKVRIVSVDYVLAPDHRFPDPVDDCVAAARSIYANASKLGMNPQKLAIGGASAGANLALSTAISLRDTKQTWLRFMLLFYGVFDMTSTSASRTLFSEGFGMGADAMELFYSLYVAKKEDRTLPMASPLLADLGELPPAFINGAGLDVLRDDSRQLATKINKAGGQAHLHEVPGVIHGYTLLTHEVSAARDAIELAGQALYSALR